MLGFLFITYMEAQHLSTKLIFLIFQLDEKINGRKVLNLH